MKRYHKINKRINRCMHRYINGTKGVISLFLAILMLPFASVGGALINSARVNSAVAVFDEALCNASNSTLGTYDEFLRKRFGLLAMTQDNSGHGQEYTVQELISDTFKFYMEQNTAALSNTYMETMTEAVGIYPLSDTDVLLSEVLEYGKYAIPTKLVIDGLCIDDIIKKLTEKLVSWKNAFNVMSSTGDLGLKMDDCENKFNAAIEKLDACETAKTDYSNAFSDFEAEVNRYNGLVDEMAQKVSECEVAVSDANNSVVNSNDKMNTEMEKYPEASAEWNTLKNEKDENGNAVDNSESLKEFENDHDELKDYIQAQGDLEEAQEALDTATGRLNAVTQEYQEKLDTQRGIVENRKISYVTAISSFASSIKTAGEAVVGAQNAYKGAVGAGVNLIGNVADIVYENQKEEIDKEIDNMKDSKDAAIERGDNTAAYLWDDQIQEAKAQKDAISNENTVMVKATSAVATSSENALSQFADENYAEKFNDLYTRLIELKNKAGEYVVEGGYETKMPGMGGYYSDSVGLPISGEQMRQLLGNLAKDMAESSFFDTAKALIDFIKAIFTFKTWVDLELMGSIDPSVYEGIGGLSSAKNRSVGSPYCLKSPYETEDSKKSDYYKQLLGGYSGGTSAPGNGMGADTLMNQIMADVSALSGCFDNWHWYNLFGKIKALATTVWDLVTHVMAFMGDAITILGETVGQKFLLTGYVAYNIPNRTTYKDSTLTGWKCKLPSADSDGQGYAFYGAETEYIMMGSHSEAANQEMVFTIIWLVRMLYDVGFVFTNAEVASIAGEAGAATFGIGTIVVYILYIVAEPFVDTLVLVNGGDVPIWKAKLYLTPSGIESLIKAFYRLKLTENQKNAAYKSVVNVMGAGMVGENYAQNFADAYQSGIEDPELPHPPEIVSSLTFDYTKTLLLAMLFVNREEMLERLADIIQMEASYYYGFADEGQHIGTYTFDLDKSYTYLRASGSFTMNEFMPVLNVTGLKSKQRVIYRGY